MRNGILLLSLFAFTFADDIQRPQFHVMPITNWMNDPNGPFYDPMHGYYHLFYQYNPYGAVWGNMSWGHAISKDLVFWQHLPVALYPNNTYDSGGVFSGSITLVNGNPVISYTCVGPKGQLQCLAYPADRADPYLINWVKDPNNPVINQQPPNTLNDNFRDDTTAWFDSASQQWLMAVGNQQPPNDGVVQLYQSTDFRTWTYSNELFRLPNGGMIECPDVFLAQGSPGLYCLKMSDGPDSYFLGTYDASKRSFTPSSARTLYDYGQGYASKSFFDPLGKRQVLWTWVAEEDNDGPSRGWQGLQSVPRQMTFDSQTGLLSIDAIPELAMLRNATLATLANDELPDGSFSFIRGVNGLMLEVDTYFKGQLTTEINFGVAVRVSPDTSLQTRIAVNAVMGGIIQNNTDRPGLDGYIFPMNPSNPENDNIAACQQACAQNASCAAWVYVRPGDGDCRCCLKTAVPAANSNAYCVSGVMQTSATVSVDRAASGTDGDTSLQGGPLPFVVDEDGNFETRLHIFVDHSMIEVFADGGRARITSRVYPASATTTGVALFADLGSITVSNGSVWLLNSIWA